VVSVSWACNWGPTHLVFWRYSCGETQSNVQTPFPCTAVVLPVTILYCVRHASMIQNQKTARVVSVAFDYITNYTERSLATASIKR